MSHPHTGEWIEPKAGHHNFWSISHFAALYCPFSKWMRIPFVRDATYLARCNAAVGLPPYRGQGYLFLDSLSPGKWWSIRGWNRSFPAFRATPPWSVIPAADRPHVCPQQEQEDYPLKLSQALLLPHTTGVPVGHLSSCHVDYIYLLNKNFLTAFQKRKKKSDMIHTFQMARIPETKLTLLKQGLNKTSLKLNNKSKWSSWMKTNKLVSSKW